MNGLFEKRRAAYFIPAMLYTLWLATAGWLSTYLAQQRLSDAYAPLNYTLFFVAHAAGMALFALPMDDVCSPEKRKKRTATGTVLTTVFTALMSITNGVWLMAVTALAGFCAGYFAALLSGYLYTGIPSESRGMTLGAATAAGYTLHYVLFVLLVPSIDLHTLVMEVVFSSAVFLLAGVLALRLSACRDLFSQETGEATDASIKAIPRVAPMLTLLAIVVLFSLSYGIQDLAATVYWMRGSAFLVHTRLFLISGFLLAGLLWDSKHRNMLLSGGFGLLALGFLSMAMEYKGWISFLGLAGVQLASAFFTVSIRLLFFDAAGFYRRPIFIGVLGFALPLALKQLGILFADSLYRQLGGPAIFIAALCCIALGFPFISLVFERLRDMHVLDARANTPSALPNKTEHLQETRANGQEEDILPAVAYDQEVLRALVRKYGFTRRETQVLELAIHGLVNAQIAERLNISEATVKQHIRNMLAKSGMRSLKRLILSQIMATPARDM